MGSAFKKEKKMEINIQDIDPDVVIDKIKENLNVKFANKGGNIGAYTQVVKLIKAMNDIMTEYNTYMDNK